MFNTTVQGLGDVSDQLEKETTDEIERRMTLPQTPPANPQEFRNWISSKFGAMISAVVMSFVISNMADLIAGGEDQAPRGVDREFFAQIYNLTEALKASAPSSHLINQGSDNLTAPELRAVLHLIVNRWQFLIRMHQDQQLGTGPFSSSQESPSSQLPTASQDPYVENWEMFSWRVSFSALVAPLAPGSSSCMSGHYSVQSLSGALHGAQSKGVIGMSSSPGSKDQRVEFDVDQLDAAADDMAEIWKDQTGKSFAGSFFGSLDLVMAIMGDLENPWSAKELVTIAALATLRDFQDGFGADTSWTIGDLTSICSASRNGFKKTIKARGIDIEVVARTGHRNLIALHSYSLPDIPGLHSRDAGHEDWTIETKRVDPVFVDGAGKPLEIGGGGKYLAGSVQMRS